MRVGVLSDSITKAETSGSFSSDSPELTGGYALRKRILKVA
jgi:hypothetical protein